MLVFDPLSELGPTGADKVFGVFGGHIDRSVFPDVEMPTRVCLHGSDAVRHLKANPRAFVLLEPLGLPAIKFIVGPALHFGMEHLQGSAAGIDLVVMSEIGEPFESAEQVLVPAGAPDLDVAGAALRTER